jgi:hypothetical protein
MLLCLSILSGRAERQVASEGPSSQSFAVSGLVVERLASGVSRRRRPPRARQRLTRVIAAQCACSLVQVQAKSLRAAVVASRDSQGARRMKSKSAG